MFFSFIIPVYNRPDDMQVVLEGLSAQTYKNFEVIVIESGSSIKSDEVAESFKGQLSIQYFYKANEGQGFSRNYGMEQAKGEYLIILDSDIIIPPDYLEQVYQYLSVHKLDAFGGPDKAHHSFTPVQKAADYALTSYLTTGGTRGRKKQAGKYFPRSFNMGLSRQVYENTQGFKLPNCGEDIELSIRIQNLGYKTGLIPDAFVYHKRKKRLGDFFKQMVWFGRSRINIYRIYPESLKAIHLLPPFFCLFVIVTLLLALVNPFLFKISGSLLLIYFALIFIDATARYRSLMIGFLSIITSFSVFAGYGWGMVKYALHSPEGYRNSPS